MDLIKELIKAEFTMRSAANDATDIPGLLHAARLEIIRLRKKLTLYKERADAGLYPIELGDPGA